MNKEVNQIIKDYKPHDGFFDLSEQPKTLSKAEYAKVLNIQNFLASYRGKEKYIKKQHPSQWRKLLSMSAQLQQIIFQHWGNSVFDS